ncbi:MAG: ABC transporter ATP-binding protein [Lachnospiraceae bacterium]|nr:ABC transporter ATP-binding protein [Lachnospiraceae bacterium]MCI9132666.1 ABC transporter ATP-binding protein [Lachnospiraceae bacterium]
MQNMLKKLRNIFDRKQKREIGKLMVLVLIGAFSELMGVSVIVPFINAITEPETLMREPVVQEICQVLGITQAGRLIVGIAIVLSLIYVVKNAIALILADQQYKFSFYGRRDLKNRMMRCYMNQNYAFHQENSSADLMRNINNDTDMFYETVLNMLQLVSELCVCAVLVTYLLITDVVITLCVAFSMGILVCIFLTKFRKELVKLGNHRRTYMSAMTKCMQQGFGGIKEIKVSNKEGVFCKDYEKSNLLFTEAMRKNLLLNAIPKPVMEAICIMSLMAVIAVKVCLGSQTDDFITTLGVFAVAAFKLLPSVNKISGFFSTIMHNGVVVDVIEQEVETIRKLEKNIQNEEGHEREKLPFHQEIHLEDISFRYPNTEEDVLEHVTLTIPKNQSVAFIGPSGAGKTTLVDLILGVMEPTAGEIQIDGEHLKGKVREWHRQIGYIPQTIYMLDDTIRNNVRFELSEEKGDDERVWKALEEAQLKEFVEGLEQGLDTVIGEGGTRLSGGQRQRIGIARALYREPSVLVLDEATSALDGETEAAVMESINHLQGKMTLLIIAHRLSTIEKCEIVYEVKEKRIVLKEHEPKDSD